MVNNGSFLTTDCICKMHMAGVCNPHGMHNLNIQTAGKCDKRPFHKKMPLLSCL
jgi:hypothetical protein